MIASFSVTLPFSVHAQESQSKALSQQQHAGPWTLSQALERALAINPSVQKAREGVRVAEADLGTAYSAFLPVVNGTGEVTWKKDASSSASAAFNGDVYNTYRVGIDATQSLFQRGSWAGLSFARKTRDIAKADAEIAENQVRRDVYKAFFTILLAQRKHEILTRLQGLMENSLGVIQRKYRIGTARELDVLQQRTQLALQTPQIEQAASDIRIAASQLAHLLDENENSTITVRGTLNVPTSLLVTPPTGSEASRPELRRMELLEERFDDERTVKLADHWPDLQAVGSWGRLGNSRGDVLDPDYSSWSVGLKLTVPLFSGLSSFQERKSLSAQKAQLDQDRKALLDQLSLEMVTARQNLELKRLLIESSQKAQALASQSFQYAQRTYGLGTTPFSQFSDVREALLQSELSLEQARFEALQALLDYYLATNHPTEDLARRLSAVTQP